jgi:hypothetical protein
MMNKNSQRGNALFLILIAVVLFAALSYAITQSNRSGSNPNEESNLVGAASVVSIADAIRQDLLRMQLRGISPDDIDFTYEADISNFSPPFANKFFHPEGGSSAPVKQNPSYNQLDNDGVLFAKTYNTDIPWAVGRTKCLYDPTRVCFFAVVVSVKKSVCEAINQKLTGSKNIPILSS